MRRKRERTANINIMRFGTLARARKEKKTKVGTMVDLGEVFMSQL